MGEEKNKNTWICSHCGESLESQFEICWNCGTTIERETDSDFEKQKKLNSDEYPYKGNPRPKYRVLVYSLVIYCLLYFSLTLIYERVFSIERETFSEFVSFDIHSLLLFSLSIMILGILISLWTHKKDFKKPKSRLLSGLYLDEQIACPHCLTINHPLSYFCITCMTPLTSHAAIDPMYRIFAQGNTYQKAVSKPANFLVVLGIWLLFGSQIIPGVYACLDYLQDIWRPNTYYPIGYPSTHNVERNIKWELMPLYISSLFMLLLYVAIVVKVTRNYLYQKNEDMT